MNTPIYRFRIFFVCLFFTFPYLLFSQKKSLHFGQGRLFTTKGIEITFVNLNQQGSMFTIETRKGKFHTFDKNEILRIDQKKGSEALVWAGYMGSIGLLEGILLTSITKPPTSFFYNNQKRKRLLVVGSTVLSATMGLIIGARRKKYKRIYDDPAFSFSPKKLGLNLSAPNNVSSLTLSYHF